MCAKEGCSDYADVWAVGRDRKARKYCEQHAEEISTEDRPEYVAECPKCGCLFGVN